MFPQVIAPHEPFPALMTLELLRSAVRFFVSFELVASAEASLASRVRTQVRFFAGMDSNMRFQVRTLIIPFIASLHRTGVFLISGWQHLSRAYAHHGSRFIRRMRRRGWNYYFSVAGSMVTGSSS